MAFLKDGVSVLREALPVVLFLMLLFLPGTIKTSLEKAGFTKGSLLGFEWEKEILASSEHAKGAGQAISAAARLRDPAQSRRGGSPASPGARQ